MNIRFYLLGLLVVIVASSAAQVIVKVDLQAFLELEARATINAAKLQIIR